MVLDAQPQHGRGYAARVAGYHLTALALIAADPDADHAAQSLLDVERFVEKIVDGRVAVLQVVPSYLEVVLAYLESHAAQRVRGRGASRVAGGAG
ncbi:hypothetical protein K4749_09645 [Streptomyces sp. TRM72054]|uniref:hypothetical protein n=1 Tax=Streptomyces sp. TRM72054 TaxID=2870562 RepID=UPI001C8BCDF5|nr:hypothetical protein [Streptomyces sp. TRM72054]MBX9393850.1 hypothetical protein [Streptomyces sp. TRM72054]